MSHYYTNDEVKSEMFKFNITLLSNTLSFYSDNGVFSKRGLDYGSRFLLETFLEEKKEGKTLDVGCGYGVLGIFINKITESKVDMIDINKRAVHLSNMNIKENNLSNIKAYYSDVYQNVLDIYKYIITNPPIRAGKDIIFKILIDAKKHMDKSSELWFVMRKNHGLNSVLKVLENEYIVEVLKKSKGFFIIKAKIA